MSIIDKNMKHYNYCPFALLCFLAFSSVNGFTCNNITTLEEKECTIPPVQDLKFCNYTMDYAICQTENSWIEQDKLAQEKMEKLLQSYGRVIMESNECYEAVKRFQCASSFPVCMDIGAEASLVCESECDVVRTACKYATEGNSTNTDSSDSEVIRDLYSLDEEAYARICDVGFLEPAAECFTLDYDGPVYYTWAIGLSLAVVFSLLNSLALNVQKLSLNKHSIDTPVIKQPIWILGFCMLLLGSIVDFVAFGLAPQSLLAPLAALSLVWNMVLAPCFLKEKLNKEQILATMIIFAGAVITVIFSNHTSPVYTLEILVQLFLTDSMRIYTIAIPAFVLLHMIAVEVIEALPQEKWNRGFLKNIHMIGYAGAAGTVGGQSVLFAKSTVEILKSTVAGETYSWARAEAYFILSGMVLCLLMQITYLNGGLYYHEALTIVPVYQAYWIISGIIGGLVYFDEIRTFTPLMLGMFCFGVLVTICGVTYLAHIGGRESKPLKPIAEEEEDYDEEEWTDKHLGLPAVAFEGYLNMTPRSSAAQVLLDMGVQPKKVSRLLGATHQSRMKQKEIVLTDMGVRPEIAARMLRSSSSHLESMNQSQRSIASGGGSWKSNRSIGSGGNSSRKKKSSPKSTNEDTAQDEHEQNDAKP